MDEWPHKIRGEADDVALEAFPDPENDSTPLTTGRKHVPVKPVPFREGRHRAHADIFRERLSHKGKGFDAEHDKEVGYGHLILLAGARLDSAYAAQGLNVKAQAFAREQLVKAAALIVAAIDVIDLSGVE